MGSGVCRGMKQSFFKNGDDVATVDLRSGEHRENISILYFDGICANDRNEIDLLYLQYSMPFFTDCA